MLLKIMPKLPSKEKVLKWSNQNLLEWLQKEDLHDCLQAFKSRDINGAELLDLSDDLVITFSELKINRRRQIVKCINECKTQACNAKKLVGNIKDQTKHRGGNESDDDEDDDVGWGSDFDDEEESDNDNEDVAKVDRFKASVNTGKYEIKPTEDLYEQVSEYMSDGIQTMAYNILKDENEPNFKAIIADMAQNKEEISEDKNKNQIKNGLNNEMSQINGKEMPVSDTIETSSSIGVKGVSPKPSPRVLPKPPNTKPQVPKNKPQIIPRKPLNNNGMKTPQNSQLKRPPSEPPPPPLPKSPPPMSPLMIPSELIFSDNSNNCSNSRNDNQETYESLFLAPVLEDEYLSPIRTETPIIMDRKASSSTISSLSYSTRDSDSPIGAFPSLSPQTSNHSLNNNSPEEDYEPFRKTGQHMETSKLGDYNEGNYEIVNDKEIMISNDFNNMLPIGQRPLLPKVKESTPVSKPKTKLIPDVFPDLSNWPRIAKKPIKDKQENDPIFEDNTNLSPNLDLNSSLTGIPVCARPLPPLPQSHTFIGNESIRAYPWYHSVERENAEALLMTLNTDGAYLVRESKRAGKSNPYTLTIFHDGRVFHLNIRKRPDGLYALGKDKPREKTFKTVADLVSYHTSEAILLTTRGTPAGKTRLILTPSP